MHEILDIAHFCDIPEELQIFIGDMDFIGDLPGISRNIADAAGDITQPSIIASAKHPSNLVRQAFAKAVPGAGGLGVVNVVHLLDVLDPASLVLDLLLSRLQLRVEAVQAAGEVYGYTWELIDEGLNSAGHVRDISEHGQSHIIEKHLDRGHRVIEQISEEVCKHGKTVMHRNNRTVECECS